MNLKIGDHAPDFSAPLEDGSIFKLSEIKKKKVVLYFYPQDDTPTCTTESCNLRDNYHRFQAQGYEIFGISSDNEKSHRKFIKKFNLPFSLIADTDRKVHDLYGTWVEKQLFGRNYMGTARTTFIIDEHGKIDNIIEKVVSKIHSDQILGG